MRLASLLRTGPMMAARGPLARRELFFTGTATVRFPARAASALTTRWNQFVVPMRLFSGATNLGSGGGTSGVSALNGAADQLVETIREEIDTLTVREDSGLDESVQQVLRQRGLTWKETSDGTVRLENSGASNQHKIVVTFAYAEFETKTGEEVGDGADADGNEAGDDHASLESVPIKLELGRGSAKLVIEGDVVRPVRVEGEAEERYAPYLEPSTIVVGESTYTPKFDELDEPLQSRLGEWLSEVGVDEQLFGCILDLAYFTEAVAYEKWLRRLSATTQGLSS